MSTFSITYNQQHIGERTPEVRPINIRTFFLRHIHFLTSGAVNLNSRSSYLLTHSNRQNRLSLTQHARTHSEHSLLIFVSHNRQPLRREDESRVDQTVNIGCLLIDCNISASILYYRSSSSSSSSGGSGRRIISIASLNSSTTTYNVRTSALVHKG